MKKIAVLLLAITLFVTPAHAVETLSDGAITLAAPSALLMEKTTGEVIYEKNADERLSPASVTKVMSLLLFMEEIEAGRLSVDDMITASSHAASMGGSQIWLEEGEQMSVHEMLKCVAVSSANDCTVALAEHIAGSEEAFTARMNERAAALGLENTHFCDCTGLGGGPEHYSSSRDIAVMSRELLAHERIREYTTIWMDTVRGGEFGLSNTNRLIFHYEGATGLKTGFTSEAMYCLSATAERDGAEYIAVVMHCGTSDERFDSARTLLNYAFANYALIDLSPREELSPVRVELGEEELVRPVCEAGRSLLLPKTESAGIEYSVELADSVEAPVSRGDALGILTVRNSSGIVAELPLVAEGDVGRLGPWASFVALLRVLVCGGEM